MTTVARWAYGPNPGRNRCRFCGHPGVDCPPVTCLLCASTQCGDDGTCRVCQFGLLNDRPEPCRPAGCDGTAVSRAPRIGRVCARHAKAVRLRVGDRTVPLLDHVAGRLAHRDAGGGWERWRLAA